MKSTAGRSYGVLAIEPCHNVPCRSAICYDMTVRQSSYVDANSSPVVWCASCRTMLLNPIQVCCMVGRLYNMSCQCQMPWPCYIVYQLYNHVIKSNAGRSYGMPVIPSYDMPVIQSCQCQLPSAGAMVCELVLPRLVPARLGLAQRGLLLLEFVVSHGA